MIRLLKTFIDISSVELRSIQRVIEETDTIRSKPRSE